MHLGYAINEYGTRVSKHRCGACGSEFTVCPAIPPEKAGWDCCLGPKCTSYDPDRDVDKLLDSGTIRIVPGLPRGQA